MLAVYFSTYTFFRDARNIQDTEIENEYGVMQCPDTLRIVVYGINDSGVCTITDISEISSKNFWRKNRRPKSWVHELVNTHLIAGKYTFSIEPVITDPVYPLASPHEPELHVYDWREQPDWDIVNDLISKFEKPFITCIDTASDQNAILITEGPVDAAVAQEEYNKIIREMANGA